MAFRRPPERGSLEQQRDQHHEEGDVKEQPRVIQSCHHREDSRDNGHRAAQPHPADKDPFAQVEAAKRQQTGKHRQGRAKKIIHADKISAGTAIGSRSDGVTSRPSTRNIPICASRQPVEVLQNGVTVANRAIAQQEAAEINREDPAAVQRSGDGKMRMPPLRGKQRVEPRRQRYPVDRLLKQVTPAAERNPGRTAAGYAGQTSSLSLFHAAESSLSA